MKELRAILQTFEGVRAQGQFAVLATVVKVSGSVYRRPGARMLIAQDGVRTGAISGGCLENDVAERAQQVLASGDPLLVEYDMTSEEEALWGFNMGCNGMVQVLMERVPEEREPQQLSFLAKCLYEQQAGVMAIVFRVEGALRAKSGSRLVLWENGTLLNGIEEAKLSRAVLADAKQALQDGKTVVQTYSLPTGEAEVLIEVIQPVPLLIFGAGADALPLVRLVKELGWHVTVVDHRPAYADPDRFPEADAVILATPEEVPHRLRLSPHTVAVIMTHDYACDLELLRRLLASPVRYLGVLGPRRRTERLLKALRESGLKPTPEQLSRLFSPIGLDIGAERPEEIALAILAEIQAVLSGRRGGFLRERRGSIH